MIIARIILSAIVDKVLVDPDYQGKGIGKEILNFIEMFAKKNNATKIVLDVVIGNPVLGFYEKLGFQKTEILLGKKIL